MKVSSIRWNAFKVPDLVDKVQYFGKLPRRRKVLKIGGKSNILSNKLQLEELYITNDDNIKVVQDSKQNKIPISHLNIVLNSDLLISYIKNYSTEKWPGSFSTFSCDRLRKVV